MPDDSVFKALADPTRRRVLRLLSCREMTAGEISAHFDITAPSMSHHFNLLKQAGLIVGRRAGQQIYYSINTTVAQELLARLMEVLAPAPHEEDSK